SNSQDRVPKRPIVLGVTIYSPRSGRVPVRKQRTRSVTTEALLYCSSLLNLREKNMKATRNRSRFALALVASLLLLFAGSLRSFGQESRASLAGKVTDPTDAVVVGATVTVISVETGVVQTATTNRAGEWRVEALNP